MGESTYTAAKVKICGITSREDALAAVDAGADFLGFMFAPSPRRVDRSTAARIVASLPSSMITVGVFVDAPPEEMGETCRECGIAVAQLHGREQPETGRILGAERTWKAFRIRSEDDMEGVSAYTSWVSGILLDAYSPNQAGGTGQSFDWRLAQNASRFGLPIILAGGLNPQNVAEAIQQVQPHVVDVSSGVELAPGRKDPALIRAFVRAVRRG